MTHCINQALLVKIGWKIVQNEQGLWSQVLNGNYLKDQSLLAAPNLKFLNCSSTWREQSNDADHMAHMDQHSNLGYHVLDLPSPIVSLLGNDSVRKTTARLVPV
ncbi:hypothetical protein L3X38_029105 [Prunus dulcis]|uniref:Uncharacterized protein n=1 Tax=Prunus dulcis TaxID=3755 RepID=A0AAD4Z2N6_PRUDU|nr:hypothetical protein L3X38_029105 [Prunus dulcis]